MAEYISPLQSKVPYDVYRSTLPQKNQQIINRVANAVGCILTNDNQVNGSALLIHNNFALVPKHCFPFDKGKIKFGSLPSPVDAESFLDGDLDVPKEFRSDFKIVYIVDTYNLISAPLSVDSPFGKGVQLNYQLDGNLYALPYESSGSVGGYATRSDLSSVITINGDSGGARLSWNSGGVCSIHQGQSEALTINQIYHTIEMISKSNTNLQCRALEILSALSENIVDMPMLRMQNSTVYLHPNQVIPERHGTLKMIIISGESIYKVAKDIKDDVFKYCDTLNEDSKKALFNAIWGPIGTIHKFDTHGTWGTRLDVQSPGKDSANLQIQVKGQTIATVQVAKELQQYGKTHPARALEVVNYMLRKFRDGVNYAYGTAKATNVKISLIPL